MSKRLTKDQILAIPELLKTMSGVEIAEKYGVTHVTIHKWINKLRSSGVEIPLKPGPRPVIM